MEQKLKNKKVEGKLRLAFGCTLATLIVAIVVAIVAIIVMNSNMNTFYKEAYANSTVSMEIRKDMQYIGKNVLWSMTTDDLDKTNEYLSEVDTASANVKKNVAKLIKTYPDSKITKEINEDFTTLRETRAKMVEYAKENKNDEALAIFNGDYNDVVQKLQDTLVSVGDYSETEAQGQYNTARTIGIICLVLMIVIGIFSVLLSSKITKIIVKALTDPIHEIQAATEQLKAGNLDVEITYQSEDELGDLAVNFHDACQYLNTIVQDTGYLLGELANGNFKVRTDKPEAYIGDFSSVITSMRDLRTALSETLSKINEASEQVAAGSEQLAEGAQVLAEGATDQAGAVEELTATVEDVSNMSTNVATEAEESYHAVLEAVQNAESSKEDLGALTAAMESIDTTSKEIQKIIGAIEDIASQTNLLSLNASIEAARAGEGGKGFAVVANQIGKLASDSAQSAVNTRELIEKSLVEVEHGNAITAKTVEALNDILEKMDEFAKTAKQQSDVSQNQAQMLGQIEQGIEQISSVVQSNSASAQETSATSEELSAQSESLKELIGRFRLPDHE